MYCFPYVNVIETIQMLDCPRSCKIASYTKSFHEITSEYIPKYLSILAKRLDSQNEIQMEQQKLADDFIECKLRELAVKRRRTIVRNISE